MAPHPARLRWFQIPLSSDRVPRSDLFSYKFQDSLQRYQQLRAEKRLRVGWAIAPPPPGLLQPRLPGASPPASPPRASRRPRGAAWAQAPRVSPGSRKRAHEGQQPAGTAQRRARGQDVPSRGPRPHQAALGGARHIPVAAAGPLRGGTDRGQSGTARTVAQQLGRSRGGQQVGTARGSVSPPASEEEEEELIPLRDLLLAGDEPPSPAGHQQAVCPQQEPLVNSLDSLLQEKREQSQAGTLQGSLAWVEEDDDGSASKSPSEDSQMPEEHRDFLARFSTHSSSMPTLHPGEPIFCAQPALVPTLDAHGLQPQSSLERLFLQSSPSCQAALACAGGLRLLYHSVPTCPVPVLRWIFQLLTLCPPPPNALRVLCDLWLGTEGDQPWCPTLQEITQAVAQLGANLSPLLHRRLLPPELCPASTRALEPSCSPREADANSSLVLAAQLGDICQFLALCVDTQPCSYSDGARLALLTLFSFLGLARALRCQPLPELQHLLHCLLEGIRDWQEQLPALCQALCQLSQHHHNLVALVQLLPDLTSRGRELCQLLSLHAMARLLGEPPGAVPPPGARAELEVLCQLLALAQPDALRRLALASGLERAQDVEMEVCYLSRSLLLLASTVVGTECPAAEQRGALQQLCAQLEQHFRSGQRRGTQLCGAQLESLVTLLFVKWQEMLA